jgi:molecular chaperone HscB
MPDPFDTLGLPARFDLDPLEVERAYLARSADLHPDLAGADPDAERLAAELNGAKRALSDPEMRADALLRRLGGPTREKERSLPSGFLMEIMGIREEIESSAASGDPAAAAKWEEWAEGRRRELIGSISAMFAGLGDKPDADALRAIRVELNVWRYIERLVEQLE